MDPGSSLKQEPLVKLPAFKDIIKIKVNDLNKIINKQTKPNQQSYNALVELKRLDNICLDSLDREDLILDEIDRS